MPKLQKNDNEWKSDSDERREMFHYFWVIAYKFDKQMGHPSWKLVNTIVKVIHKMFLNWLILVLSSNSLWCSRKDFNAINFNNFVNNNLRHRNNNILINQRKKTIKQKRCEIIFVIHKNVFQIKIKADFFEHRINCFTFHLGSRRFHILTLKWKNSMSTNPHAFEETFSKSLLKNKSKNKSHKVEWLRNFRNFLKQDRNAIIWSCLLLFLNKSAAFFLKVIKEHNWTLFRLVITFIQRRSYQLQFALLGAVYWNI